MGWLLRLRGCALREWQFYGTTHEWWAHGEAARVQASRASSNPLAMESCDNVTVDSAEDPHGSGDSASDGPESAALPTRIWHACRVRVPPWAL
jgi:hypothetical protein